MTKTKQTLTQMQIKMLVHLFNNQTRILSPSQLTREIQSTYSYTQKILRDLEDSNYLIYIKINRRAYQLKLTKKGLGLCKILKQLELYGLIY